MPQAPHTSLQCLDRVKVLQVALQAALHVLPHEVRGMVTCAQPHQLVLNGEAVSASHSKGIFPCMADMFCAFRPGTALIRCLCMPPE